MKMDMQAKPKDTEETADYEYSEEQLEEMLEALITAKKIESNPEIKRMVKEYAVSKNKMVDDMFSENVNDAGKNKPKSFSDLKEIADKKNMSDEEE